MEIRNFLLIPLLALTAHCHAAYTPAIGPLTLGDRDRTFGTITSTINTIEELDVELKALKNSLKEVLARDREVGRLINEPDQRANIALGKRRTTGIRMKLTAHFCRHRKKYVAVGVGLVALLVRHKKNNKTKNTPSHLMTRPGMFEGLGMQTLHSMTGGIFKKPGVPATTCLVPESGGAVVKPLEAQTPKDQIPQTLIRRTPSLEAPTLYEKMKDSLFSNSVEVKHAFLERLIHAAEAELQSLKEKVLLTGSVMAAEEKKGKLEEYIESLRKACLKKGINISRSSNYDFSKDL